MNNIEKKYVHDTYQLIASDFDTTRTYLWQGVKVFLDSIEKNSIILEIGSGNGKNLLKRQDCINIGIDLCSNFCKISTEKGIESIVGNNLKLPILDNIADYVLSIAVIHHLTTEERRFQCIKEIIRVLKPKGKFIIQVWSLKQPEKSRRKFIEQDNFVDFISSDKKTKESRFYHVFLENELENLLLKLYNINIISTYWELGNYIVIGQKKF